MKKNLLGVAASALAISFVFVPAVVSATGYANDADVVVLQDALDAINTFSDTFNDSSVSASTVIADGTIAQEKLTALSNHTFMNSFGADYTQATSALRSDANAISNDIGTIDEALQANNLDAANAAIVPLNKDVDTFNTDKTTLNDVVDHQNQHAENTSKKQTAGYLALFIATIVLAIGSFAWARRRPAENELLYQARRKVAIASIWPAVGAGITYGTFIAATKTGGTYYVAYGPIAIGAALYLRGIGEYKTKKRQAVAGPMAPLAPPAGPMAPPITPQFGPAPPVFSAPQAVPPTPVMTPYAAQPATPVTPVPQPITPPNNTIPPTPPAN